MITGISEFAYGLQWFSKNIYLLDWLIFKYIFTQIAFYTTFQTQGKAALSMLE